MIELEPFLQASDVVDWHHRVVLERARTLARGHRDTAEIARSCFEWTRDQIAHAGDHRVDRVTCAASEVLVLGAGFCFAKSHLLAALLRANAIPAGFVYQRLAGGEGKGHCLHGLNAVWLPDVGWFRVDARGSREDLGEARFQPPAESLPYAASGPGEILFPGVWAAPAPLVVKALGEARDRTALLTTLPDAVDLGEPDVRLEASISPG